jgi:iron complex transport system substrate-binding protein
VAVDATSQYPAEALKEKQTVGYLRALSTEGVLSMNPTLLLVSESAGPPEVVKALKSASIPYIEVPDGQSPEGIVHKVRLIAGAVGAGREGERLARTIEAEFGVLAEETAKIQRPLRALFVLAGAENAAAEVTGFRPLSDEAIVGLAPDVIVGMRATQSSSHDLSEIFSLKGVQSTPAGAARRLVTMNGLFLLGFGPRAPAAARELMRAIYPELGGAGGPR